MRSRNNADELSLASVALALGMDRPTIAKRLDAIKAVPDGEGKVKTYKLRDVIRALASDCGASCKNLSYNDQLAIARTEQTKVATQAAELKLQIQSGEYAHKSAIAEEMQKIVQPIDQFLLTLGDQLEFDCGLNGATVERLNKAIMAQRETLKAAASA